MFWSGSIQGDVITAPRDRICAAEVWCEALGGFLKDLNKTIARDINGIIEQTREWQRSSGSLRFGPYGVQRGFIKEA
jgi:hypothetical protein